MKFYKDATSKNLFYHYGKLIKTPHKTWNGLAVVFFTGVIYSCDGTVIYTNFDPTCEKLLRVREEKVPKKFVDYIKSNMWLLDINNNDRWVKI